MLVVLSPTKLTDFYGLLPFSQSGNFNRITILRNGGFSALFGKYVLFVWNKLCRAPIKWLKFWRVWGLLILLTVLELISQSSNFARITILRSALSVCRPLNLFSCHRNKCKHKTTDQFPKTLETCHFIFRTHYQVHSAKSTNYRSYPNNHSNKHLP